MRIICINPPAFVKAILRLLFKRRLENQAE